MTSTSLDTTPAVIGLAAAGAAALGLSLADGLLQPTERLLELARRRKAAADAPAATPATGGGTRRSSSAAPTAAQAAELERQRALYSRPAPGRELEACKIRIPEDAE